MKIECFKTSTQKTRYLLVDAFGNPIVPVMQFLKFKDNCGRARNTLRAYCFHLKYFYEYLTFIEKNFNEIGIDELAGFLRWLQQGKNPRVISLVPEKPARSAKTINVYLGTIYEFYNYLFRHEDYRIRLSDKLTFKMSNSRRGFKDFLYHINKSKYFDAKLLKLKEPKQCIKTISKDDISKILRACYTVRDKFLIQLLWESGMRISEALALWLEDFEPDARRIHIHDRGELQNLAEIKTICSPRTLDVSSDLINLYFDYIAAVHTDEVDTNHVFIKQCGARKYEPMEYSDVSALILRLKARSGIHFTPHILRHSSLSELRRCGWPVELLQKRAGHAFVQSTYVYLHPDDGELHEQWQKSEEKMKINKGEQLQ